MSTPPPLLDIRLFGPLQVRIRGRLVERWQRRDARELLVLLAVQVDHRLPRQRVCELLWPEAEAPLHRLKDAVYTLRRVLGEAALALKGQGDLLVLDTAAGLWIDSDEFERLLDVGLLNADAADALQRALVLYAAPLLADEPPAPWLDAPRRHLALRCQVAQEALAARRPAAPPVLAAPTPPPATTRFAARGLPTAGPPLVERDEPAARCIAALSRPAEPARLLTLTGPGGVGKTRLALHVAAALLPHFAQRVALVELAPLARADDVALTIAKALGRPALPPGEPAAALAAHLGDAPALLVLDTLEHLPDAAPLLAALLEAAPALQLLCTSRTPLHLAAEEVLALPGLAVPDEGATRADDVLRYGAAQLFTQRARAADPTFAFGDRGAAALAALCRQLEGLPLALELAAARVRLYGVAGLQARLAESIDVLQSQRRDGPERHHSLLAVLDWSWRLLPPAAQRLLGITALLDGGFTLPMLQGLSVEPAEGVVQALEALLDHHLATAVAVGEPGDGASPRWRLYDTVRVFARERLQEQGDAPSLSRFVLYWAAEAGRLDSARRGGGAAAPRAFEEFEREHANFDAALALALRHDRETAQILFARLGRFWLNTGRIGAGLGWLGAVVDREACHTSAWRTEAAVAACLLRLASGDSGEALAWEAAVRGSPHLQHQPRLQVELMNLAGAAEMRLGRVGAAADRALHALAFARAGADAATVLNCRGRAMWCLMDAGRFGEARALAAEGLDGLDAGRDLDVLSLVSAVSHLAFVSGDLARARALAVQCSERARGSGAGIAQFIAASNETYYAFCDLQLDEARRHAETVLQLAERIGDPGLLATVPLYHALVQVLQQRWDAACDAFDADAPGGQGVRTDNDDLTLLWQARAQRLAGRPQARATFRRLLQARAGVRLYLLAAVLDEAAQWAGIEGPPEGAARLAGAARAWRLHHGLRPSPLELRFMRVDGAADAEAPADAAAAFALIDDVLTPAPAEAD